ncbi:hypothetical protein BKA67DRAFT_417333 [Truncatella angustata]|uniref:Uncharacterized protein n=1 Tax=Truncatella angustata TaxID=152316 RepID=A0A9P8RP78_9PEZI|nr:uncharacterized protein BKA67DRAFT_417333 [Truncatella angustata]KAH6646825.1 hypothetical protein BKA67DRAFT_417333 [Truncatella angustata]
MSPLLGMALISLWTSGKHGTAVGGAAVKQILAGTHPSSIHDIMCNTPTHDIKLAIQALQEVWDLLEKEISSFRHNNNVFQNAYLSKDECFIISTMVPTLLSPGLGEAAFLASNNFTNRHPALKRKRPDESEDGEGSRVKRLSTKNQRGEESSHLKRKRFSESDGEEEPRVKRMAVFPDTAPPLFSPWARREDLAPPSLPIDGVARLSVGDNSIPRPEKRKLDSFRELVMQADEQLFGKRAKHKNSNDHLEPTPGPVIGDAERRIKLEQDEKGEIKPKPLWDIPRYTGGQ